LDLLLPERHAVLADCFCIPLHALVVTSRPANGSICWCP
jgi:hypothetical protein